jgi:nucleolar protein 9
MPKENKVRGRREKRKRDEQEGDAQPTKRQRSQEADEIKFIAPENIEKGYGIENQEEAAPGPTERPFYGMLEDEEQEYFRRADELLELNDFPSPEERAMFLANVYREAEGKELKIANSQSCSRLMERLILLSTAEQKKKLFERFSGNFLHLIQHRFASHCCETLFIQSARVVTEELTSDVADVPEGVAEDDAVYVSMENLFLYTLNELEGHMSFLLTDRFASHTLRVLLVVLSGQSLAKSSTKTLLQSKKKEKIGITNLESGELSLEKRAVPESFDFAIEKILSDTVAGLDTTFIRLLATHPTGNPSLQLILELELTRQKKGPASPNSIIGKILPDDISAPESESASFINGIIYDPLGSRLLETIITFAPGKLFKQIYRVIFKDRIGSLARNEIASFVVIKVLERLSKEDLEEAVVLIIPQIAGLIERNRTTVIKTLFERCSARRTYSSLQSLTKAVAEGYGSDPSTLVLKMTKTPPLESKMPQDTRDPDALHGALLAQSMLLINEGGAAALIQTSLLSLEQSTLLRLGTTTTTSHILQVALTPSNTTDNLAFRRKLVNIFLTPNSGSEPESTPIMTLATSKAGSHTLDALFSGTVGIMQLKERITTELVSNEPLLRDDFIGRVVWRNWMCDLFKRRRGDWITKVKAGEGGSAVGMRLHGNSLSETAKPGKEAVKEKEKEQLKPNGGKTAIQLAREKFAASGRAKKGKATGANAIST